MWPGWNADCSVSAKKLSGFRFEDHPADRLERHHLLGDELGRVENVERELRGGFLVERLDGELELGKVARVDGVEQIAALKVGIRAVDLHGLVPDDRRRRRASAASGT